MARDDNLALLKAAVGDTLIDCVLTQHVSADGKHSDLDYYLRFDSSGWIQIRGAPNGEGVRLGRETGPEAYDMGESGHVRTQALNPSSELSRVIGKRLTAVRRIVLPKAAEPIGIQLQLGQQSVVVVNWGDTLHASADVPQQLIELGVTIE